MCMRVAQKLPINLSQMWTLPFTWDRKAGISKVLSTSRLIAWFFAKFSGRLTSDASISTAKCSSPPSTAAPSLLGEPVPLDFKGCILSKPHVNENNNLTNACGSILGALRSQGGHDPISRLSPSENSKSEETQATPIDEDDVDEEEEDSRSSESKPSLSPILSAPTTIRFPARAPEKDRPQTSDSGNCRWDKCEVGFESVSGLLEHLQVRTRIFVHST